MLLQLKHNVLSHWTSFDLMSCLRILFFCFQNVIVLPNSGQNMFLFLSPVGSDCDRQLGKRKEKGKETLFREKKVSVVGSQGPLDRERKSGLYKSFISSSSGKIPSLFSKVDRRGNQGSQVGVIWAKKNPKYRWF